MEDKLSIKELFLHYERLYNLKPSKASDDESNFQEKYGMYTIQIQRLLQDIPRDEKTLWDTIKPPKGKRKISVAEFEKNCFDSWAAYIEKNHKGEYDKIRLEKDIERHKLLTDESYLTKKMEDALEEQKRLLQEHSSDRYDEGPIPSQFITEQVAQTGLVMMVEAIYSVFYESFDWEKLHSDMLRTQVIDPVNPDVTVDQQAAIEHLKDYSNYIGARKKI